MVSETQLGAQRVGPAGVGDPAEQGLDLGRDLGDVEGSVDGGCTAPSNSASGSV